MKRLVSKYLPEALLRHFNSYQRQKAMEAPHSERVKMWGHRQYVGGVDSESWYGIGKRQYHFLVANGLESKHRFLDVACGALRLGQYLIPMLDPEKYYGLEAEPGLIEAGIRDEILFDLVSLKKPSLSL